MAAATFLSSAAVKKRLECCIVPSFKRNMSAARKTCRLLLLSYCFCCWALTSAQGSSNNAPPNVQEAIDICREKLEVDPHFPRIQHSLAQLLDSRLSASGEVDTELVDEVLELYHSVGQPSPDVVEKRLPPAKVRFDSLTRAGAIAKEIGRTSEAVRYFSLALSIDGVAESLLLQAFETVMPILLASVNVDHPVEVSVALDGTLEAGSDQAQHALELCRLVESRCPGESLVDEYRGAVLRRLKQQELAYKSYQQARVKSKEAVESHKSISSQMVSNEYLRLVGDVVRTSILVAAAAREAGYDIEQQMRYLNDAEELAVPLWPSLGANQDTDELSRDSFGDQIVDLYNNMGIAEKKQGSLKRARELFKKALEIQPNDGHALVQLASVEGGTSNVKELDAGYVSALFDGYSSRFESELVETLQYKGHSLVYDALQKALKRLGRSPLDIKRVVDIGCGTGLLGELVANEMPWASVSGVDLSQRMVEISRDRKSKRGESVYSSVSNEDAAIYLASLEDPVDCILASDVFIYIGDMSKVLEESSKRLVDDGLVCFTVEAYDGSKTDDGGLRLLPSGRFGHSRAYVEKVARLQGFEVLSWDDCILRQQARQNVKGATVVLKRAGTVSSTSLR